MCALLQIFYQDANFGRDWREDIVKSSDNWIKNSSSRTYLELIWGDKFQNDAVTDLLCNNDLPLTSPLSLNFISPYFGICNETKDYFLSIKTSNTQNIFKKLAEMLSLKSCCSRYDFNKFPGDDSLSGPVEL